MSVTKIKMLALLAAALLFTAQPAMAQSGSAGSVDIKECPQYDPPTITVVQMSGRLYQSQTKTAFQLAREKAVKYGHKMPMRQGSIGESTLRPEIKLKLEAFPEIGCIVIKDINVQVFLDHNMEFASEHATGSCMQGEFFNLEMELRQQDEEIVNNDILNMRHVLRQDIGTNYVYGPVKGVNLDAAKIEKTKEIEALIAGRIKGLDDKIGKIRQESDLVEFYDEIEKECSGGVVSKKKKSAARSAQ